MLLNPIFTLLFLIWPFHSVQISSVTCQQAGVNDHRCIVRTKAPLTEDLGMHVVLENGKMARVIMLKGSKDMQFAVGAKVLRVQIGKQKITPQY